MSFKNELAKLRDEFEQKFAVQRVKLQNERIDMQSQHDELIEKLQTDLNNMQIQIEDLEEKIVKIHREEIDPLIKSSWHHRGPRYLYEIQELFERIVLLPSNIYEPSCTFGNLWSLRLPSHVKKIAQFFNHTLSNSDINNLANSILFKIQQKAADYVADHLTDAHNTPSSQGSTHFMNQSATLNPDKRSCSTNELLNGLHVWSKKVRSTRNSASHSISPAITKHDLYSIVDSVFTKCKFGADEHNPPILRRYIKFQIRVIFAVENVNSWGEISNTFKKYSTSSWEVQSLSPLNPRSITRPLSYSSIE